MDGVISGIGRFDADHLPPVVGGHVGHSLGLVDPRIPDDGAIGAALLDDDTTVPRRIVYHASGLGAQMHLIGFLCDAHWLIAQLLAFESIGLIDVGSAFEPGNRGWLNIGDGEIRMQRLFVDEGLLRIVTNLKLHLQRGTNNHAKAQVKSGIAETPSGVAGCKRQRDLHFSVVEQSRSFDRPLRIAREAMGRTGLAIAARAKPRENDGHAAANRLAGSEQTFGADKKDGTLPTWLPMGYVSALQV